MIELENVTKTYPNKFTAVDNVSFKVPKGNILCIIGTSGCGKTTTLKMINRLVEPTSGLIKINGEDITQKDPIKLRRSIGYVIQKGGLFPHLTIEKNIGLLKEINGESLEQRRERTHELLELVSLPPEKFAKRYPHQLSGGQQQRVGIARALCDDPPIMLMDEPFGALDPITRNHLHHEFLELNEKLHKTIVLVTHDLSEAFKLGSEIMLMHRGEIVQCGGREDFVKNPVNEFAREFVQAQIEGLQ